MVNGNILIEALIMAAQEQALGTRSIKARLYHTRKDPICMLCKDAPEIIQHISHRALPPLEVIFKYIFFLH